MKTITILFALITASGMAVGQNKVVSARADIKSVTVYNSSAEVNYQKELLLPKGKSTIVFTDLTPFIVENTVNVSLSNPDVDIVTVTEKINYLPEKKNDDARLETLKDSIDRIGVDLGLLCSVTEALQVEKGLLFKDESIGGVSMGVAVAEIEKASVFFNQRYTAINTQLFQLSEREKLLKERLARYNNQVEQLSSATSRAASEISITVTNPAEKKVVFSFKFLTLKAGWAPVYDCKFEGPENPINFIFRANIFNASEVPWEDVEINLSTASPTTGFDTPSLNGTDQGTSNLNHAGNVKFKEIQVRNTVSEYHIKHNYSIPSDSKPYLVDVSTYQMAANYYYLLIPRIDPFGFLMANIPQWNQYDLIPGTTNIYNNGSYMGKTFLNTYTENDTLSLYLGKDNNIVGVRKEVNTNNQQKLIGNFYFDKSAINITVKNNTMETLKIQLLDQVPVFEIGEKIKFNLGGVEQAEYDNKQGILEWEFELAPNGSNMVDYHYEIKIPKDEIGYYKPRKRRFRTISCPSF